MDFVSDEVAGGRSFRILRVVDEFTREWLSIGSGYEFCETESDAGPGCDRGRARTAANDHAATTGRS